MPEESKQKPAELSSGKVPADHDLPSGIPNEPMLPAPKSEMALPPGSKPAEPVKPEAPKRKTTPEELQDIVENRQFAVVSYLYPLSVVVLLAKHKSKFARFHASQGMILFLLAFAFLFTPVVVQIPVQLLIFAAIVVGIFQASNGFYYKLPLIYNLTLGKLPEGEIPDNAIPIKKFIQEVRQDVEKQKAVQATSGTQTPSSATLDEARTRESAKR